MVREHSAYRIRSRRINGQEGLLFIINRTSTTNHGPPAYTHPGVCAAYTLIIVLAYTRTHLRPGSTHPIRYVRMLQHCTCTRVYAPHPPLAYTHLPAYTHPGVRTPTRCVYAPTAACLRPCANAASGAHTHPLAYTHLLAYTHPTHSTLRIRMRSSPISCFPCRQGRENRRLSRCLSRRREVCTCREVCTRCCGHHGDAAGLYPRAVSDGVSEILASFSRILTPILAGPFPCS